MRVLLFLLLTCTLSAEVSILFGDKEIIGTGYWVDGPKAEFLNNTTSRYDMAGFRMSTPDVWWKLFSGESNFVADSLGNIEGDGNIWQEIRFNEVAREDSRIIYPKGDTKQNKNMGFNGVAIPNDANGSVRSAYLMLKTGSKNRVPYDSIQPDPVTLFEIPAITQKANYYNSEYRYIDTAGANIGRYSGSMMDNFVGETQVILPLESDSITVNNVKGVISPKYTSSIYMISMIAAQEYFNIDYQFLSGIFAKETNVGTESFHFGGAIGDGKFDNSEQTFGCGEVEKNTFASVGLAQPHLFPAHEHILSGARSVNEMGSQFGFTDVMFGEEYMGKGQFTLESPYVVTSIFASAHVFFWLWDYMEYSERVCLKEVLEQHEDPYFVPALLSLLYNRGLSYDRDSVMWKQYYTEYLDKDAVDKLNTGHENYREEILVGLFAMESASKKAFEDKTIPLYDTTLTLEEMRTFFYGENGTVEAQGNGGLLKQFTVDRQQFDNDLKNGFETLAKHWNNNTISFRYDLLTLLRLLKPHLNYRRERPLDSESQSFIIARNIESDSCGCDGEVVDRSFPFGQPVGAKKESGNFLLQISTKDDNAITSVEWSIDPKWVEWNAAKGNGKEYICTIPESKLNGVDSVWVKVSDNSGNSIVRTVAPVEFGSVALKTKMMKTKQAISLVSQGNRVLLSHSIKGRSKSSITLIDSRGRLVSTFYEGDGLTAFEKHSFDLTDLSAGVYILQMQIGTNYQSVKLKR